MTDFIFVEELPSDVSGGWYAHYEHIPLGIAGWEQCDIRGIIAVNQERWLDEFDDWHSTLCNAALSMSRWWWLMPASRLNVWAQQKTLKPFLFAVAVREWRDSHPECVPIYLVGCPPEVLLYLSELEEGRERVGSAPSMLLRKLRALVIGMVRLQVQLVRFMTRYALRRPMTDRGSVLFYSHVLKTRALNEVGDPFFGDMIDTVECAMPGEVIASYLLEAVNEREQATESLQMSKRRFSFVLDHLTLWDVIWIFVTGVWTVLSLTRLSRIVPSIRLGRHVSRLFALLYVTDEILRWPPSIELAIYRAIRRVLKLSRVHTVLYPYEEKALERAILRACSEVTAPVRTLAYAHAAHTTCHLALRTRRLGCLTLPHPDKILATGPRARDFLVDWGRKRTTEVIVVGSPRHTKRGGDPRPSSDRRNVLRILVLTGHGFELLMLANFFKRRTDLFSNDEVVIRPYKFGWSDVQYRGIESLSKLSDRFKVSTKSLIDQIEWCDLVVFSSTTAGLQAMLYGRLAVYVELHDILKADPLLGYNICFARCATPDQLADTLARARTLPDSEYAYMTHIQREFAASILAPLDKTKLIDQVRGNPKPIR